MLKSVIGKGAPSVAGTSKAHGAPIGAEGVAEAKKTLGLDPSVDFWTDPAAYAYFAERRVAFDANEKAWNDIFDAWSRANPDKRAIWDLVHAEGGADQAGIDKAAAPEYKIGDNVPTRTASNAALNAFAKVLPNLAGGSADLQGPNAVALKGASVFDAGNRNGRYFHFGVREFGMASIANGIQLHGGFRAFCATFLVFSDYLRPALRLAALMKIPVIYVLTHDSIFLGEDGPTHQPIETIASIRMIPNMLLLRPADAEEAFIAWKMALEHTTGPVCLALSRQNLPVFAKDDPDWRNIVECGAYIVRKGSETPDLTILATGSEVSIALAAADKVTDKKIRVVSVMSKELFESQPEVLKKAIVGGDRASLRIVTAEAGVRSGWEGWTRTTADCFSVDRFGESGPGPKVAGHLGFTADALAEILRK
jgi:transketolase